MRTYRWFILIVVSLAGASAASAQDASSAAPASTPETAAVRPLSPNNREVTEQKSAELNQSMAVLEATSEVLDELGKLTEKQKGEGHRQYLRRVNRILKAQAFLLHLGHQQVEAALDAKYQLENTVREYSAWVDQMTRRVQDRPRRYEAEIQELLAQSRELQYDGQVLAWLIVHEGEFPDDVKKAYRQDVPADIAAVPDGSRRQDKYRKIPQSQWQEEFRRLVRALQSNELNRQFRAVKAIPESRELAELLPVEHRKLVEEAMAVLAKSNDLEVAADKIAIAAAYADENLLLVSKDVDAMIEGELLEISRKAESTAKQLETTLSQVVPGRLVAPSSTGIMTRSLTGSTPGGLVPPEEVPAAGASTSP